MCMRICRFLLYHVVENSTTYLLILFAFIQALYEIWKSEEKTWENIVSTVLACITFFFSILEVIGIQILQLCCYKEEIKQKKIISNFIDMNKTIKNAIEHVKKERLANNQNENNVDKAFLSLFYEQFTEFEENVKELRNELGLLKLERDREIINKKNKNK